MESLKIRDKKTVAAEEVEIEIEAKPEEIQQPISPAIVQHVETPQSAQEYETPAQQQQRKVRLTFGQSLMEKVKKFFEEVE